MGKKVKTIFGDAAELDKPIEKDRTAQLNAEKNMVIYGNGLLSTLNGYLESGDIDNAKKMFACYKDEALEAIEQYNPKKHKINFRSDKERLGKDEYEVAKLARPLQKNTNKIGSFFMFGNPINIKLANDPKEADELKEAFGAFTEFLDEVYFNENMYKARRITGAETECAKIYSLVKDEDGNTDVVCQIRSNGGEDTLYTLFNRYGKMLAFAVSCMTRNIEGKIEEHFEVYTKKTIWEFSHQQGAGTDWVLLDKKVNEFKKIPVIYYHHEVDWDGSQPSMDKLEWRTSKHSDTVEYFGDPYLLITADIADNRLADAKEVGKVIVMDNENGVFKYVTPPDSADMVKNEQESLRTTISEDTLTPDWTYKNIMGLGTLSGEAMRRVNITGYVKRTEFSGVYNELIRRELNLIITVLCQYKYLGDHKMVENLKRMKLTFAYTDPFAGGIEDNSDKIALLVEAGAMSVHAAVQANRYIEDKQAEEERIWEERERMAIIEAKAKAIASKSATTNKEE